MFKWSYEAHVFFFFLSLSLSLSTDKGFFVSRPRPNAPQRGAWAAGLSIGFLSKSKVGRLKARGFTILEILVVISVIAILAAIAIPKFKGMQDQGKIEKAKSELKTIQTALESYYIHHTSYPDKATYMTDLVGATPQMITAALPDPFAANGTDTYQYSKNGRNYAIWSLGLDKTNSTGAIDALGNVSSGGDDIVVTNGKVVAGAGGGGTTPGSVADGQACVNNADCASGTCTSGTCVVNGGTTPGSIAIGDACSMDADCALSGVCGGRPLVCRATGSTSLGDPCSTHSECATGYCGYDDQTGTIQQCTSGAYGTVCGSDSAACQSGNCLYGGCLHSNLPNGSPAFDVSECAGGYYGNSQICTDGSNGSICGDGAGECVSGHCANGHCADQGGAPNDPCNGDYDCQAGSYCDNFARGGTYVCISSS